MNRDVIDVRPQKDAWLRLRFEGGEQRDVDIAALVDFEGVFEPLGNADFFRRVSVNPEIGTIVWPNGADLCPDVLYEQGQPVQSEAELGAGR